MKVLISGATGLIGREVSARLRQQGHQVSCLVRNATRATTNDLVWWPSQPLPAAALANYDAIIHLAGRPVATTWTTKARQEIRDSRVLGTANLAAAAAEAFRSNGTPHTMICASAIGYYGSRGDEELLEESTPGMGFLADVCRQWEDAAKPAIEAGIRVAQLRTSIVLSPAGGALKQMLPIFRLGLGGRLGSGRQWWSWTSLNDATRAYLFALENSQLHGPMNLATPHAITNAEFTRTLAHVLHRPAFFAVPAIALRALAGEMAEEMLLSSQCVLPNKLLAHGFRFEDADLETALRKMLG